jgi:hypothetical protein
MSTKVTNTINMQNGRQTIQNFLKTLKGDNFFIPVGSVDENKIGKTKLGITPSSRIHKDDRLSYNDELTNPPVKFNIFGVPSAVANFFPKDTFQSRIRVILYAFTNVDKKEDIDTQIIYYMYGVDSGGFPKITIYVSLKETKNKKSSDKKKGILVRPYEITFTQSLDSNSKIDLASIRTIEIFLVQNKTRISEGITITVV